MFKLTNFESLIPYDNYVFVDYETVFVWNGCGGGVGSWLFRDLGIGSFNCFNLLTSCFVPRIYVVHSTLTHFIIYWLCIRVKQ